MIYIAGCNQETVHSLRIVARSEFEYTTTLDGDGRVLHALGHLKDVPTCYVEKAHGDLPRHQQVLAALDELLETGTTSVLPTQPLATRAPTIEGARWHRSLGERAIGAQLQQIADRAQRDEASPEEVRRAKEALLGAALGRHQEDTRLVEAEAPPRAVRAKEVKPLSLHVEVVCGDITKIASPVLVVGQYKGIPSTHAVGALDRAVEGWIGKGLERGMVGAELGETSFIPGTTEKIRAKAILLAGMGEPGKFTRDDLHFLMSNVGYAVSALGLSQFATVLVGSGAGNIPVDSAVRILLNGMCEALQRFQQEASTTNPIRRVMLVEFNKARYERIAQIVTDMAQNNSLPGMKLRVTSRIMPGTRGATKQEPADNTQLQQTRLTIERNGDTFRFAALTETAVVPVREARSQAFFAEEAANRLQLAQGSEEQQKYGKLLNTYLIPEDFHAAIGSHDILTPVLDRSTAAFPWEMSCFKGPARPVFFGPDLKLTRQFRTMLSSPPGLALVLNNRLKVLVIADPAPEPAWQLPGARQEGREVTTRLHRLKRDTGLDVEVVDYIGAAECDPLEILAQILTGNFDVIHFAGHGIFDERNPARSGWVFGKDRILSASEIFKARQVPRLVFANACFSAVMKEGAPLSAADTTRKLASLVEAFFERGMQNYIPPLSTVTFIFRIFRSYAIIVK